MFRRFSAAAATSREGHRPTRSDECHALLTSTTRWIATSSTRTWASTDVARLSEPCSLDCQIEAKPEIRKYKSKRLTERTPKAQQYVPSPARSGGKRTNPVRGLTPTTDI